VQAHIPSFAFLARTRPLALALMGMLLIASPRVLFGAPPSDSVASGSVIAILHSVDTAKILPDAVFFHGQSASVQMRNSGGLKFADGKLVLCALVDNGGYSTSVQEKYQGYLITEVPMEIEGHALPPGAYGVGFVKDQFVVMDIGGKDIFTVSSGRNAELKPAVPFQIVAGPLLGRYRLYFGRSYVSFHRQAGN
jgi:hypothetical protein